MPVYPNFQVFQRVTADLLNSMAWNTTVKATATSITSNTTLATDAELQGIPLTVGNWAIELSFSALGAGAGGGNVKSGWTFSGTVTGTPLKLISGMSTANTTAPNTGPTMQFTDVNWNASTTYGLTGTKGRIEEATYSFVVATAGNFAVQFAQGTSSVTATTVTAGASVRVRQLA